MSDEPRQPNAFFHALSDTKRPCCDNVDPTWDASSGDFYGDYEAWTVGLRCLSCGHVATVLIQHPWWHTDGDPGSTAVRTSDGTEGRPSTIEDGGHP